MSEPTQYRLYGGRFFTAQKTQPTVSKYWRRNLQRKTTQKHKENTKYTYAHTDKI